MLLSYLSFFTVITSLAFGIISLLIDSKTKLNRACFLLSLSFAVWAFGNIFFFIENDKSAIWFWYRISSIGWLSCFFTMPNYFMCLPHMDSLIPFWIKLTSRISLLLYSAVLIFIQFSSTLFIVDFKKTSYGNDEIMNSCLPGYYFTFVPFFLLMIICIILVVLEKKHNPSKKYTIQSNWLIFAIGVFFVALFIMNTFLPYAYKNSHNFEFLFINIISATALYLMFKYKFMGLDYTVLNNEVINTLSDMMIIVNSKGEIIRANSAARAVLEGNSNTDIVGKKLEQVLDIHESLKEKLSKIFSGKVNQIREKVCYKNSGETACATAYFARIIDRFGDFMGILIVLIENENLKNFKRKYQLTDRQLEIVMLAVRGDSNLDIEQKLNLKRRTVESHLFNVYQKLGVSSKVELIRLISDLDVL